MKISLHHQDNIVLNRIQLLGVCTSCYTIDQTCKKAYDTESFQPKSLHMSSQSMHAEKSGLRRHDSRTTSHTRCTLPNATRAYNDWNMPSTRSRSCCVQHRIPQIKRAIFKQIPTWVWINLVIKLKEHKSSFWIWYSRGCISRK